MFVRCTFPLVVSSVDEPVSYIFGTQDGNRGTITIIYTTPSLIIVPLEGSAA